MFIAPAYWTRVFSTRIKCKSHWIWKQNTANKTTPQIKNRRSLNWNFTDFSADLSYPIHFKVVLGMRSQDEKMVLEELNERTNSNLICYLFFIIWGQVLNLDFYLELIFVYTQRHMYAQSHLNISFQRLWKCVLIKFVQLDPLHIFTYVELHIL